MITRNTHWWHSDEIPGVARNPNVQVKYSKRSPSTSLQHFYSLIVWWMTTGVQKTKVLKEK